MKTIRINDKEISDTSEPFIVAEAGVNHFDIAVERSISPLEAAKLMIKEATEAGADAIKFQTYKADKLVIRDSPAYWNTDNETSKTQYELFAKYDKFGDKEYIELASYARENNVIFMSTPFDEEAVDFLDELVPVFKIASADITNIALIKHIATKKKPVFLSTGAATEEEIREAVSTIENEGNRDIVLMHCVLNYPTQYQQANLLAIQYLHDIFPAYITGYSDHTIPDTRMLVLVAAYLLGAQVLEKHFTLNKALPGNDHYHAMDQRDLRTIVSNLQLVRETLGIRGKDIRSELAARAYARRSVVAKVEIPAGSKITQDMLTCKRPGTGISAQFLGEITGRSAKKTIKSDEMLSWDDLC